MDFETHSEFNDSLRNEWNALLDESVSNVPFLRFDYLKTWWLHLGGGEWQPPVELAIITARQNGALAGIAPCFIAQHNGKKSLMFLGSIEISDYLDVIVREPDAEVVIVELFQYLKSTVVPQFGIERIDLYNLLEESPTLPLIEQAGQKTGWQVTRERLQPSPFIKLPGSWEEYLAGIDKKQRHEIRRKMRRAEESEFDVRWHFVENTEELGQAGEELLRLMAQEKDKQQFLTPPMRGQIKALLQAAYEDGTLKLAFLTVNGSNAAVYFNYDYDNRIWVYNSGLDYTFMELSPGWVLLGHLLMWANENGRKVFDFMRGDEEYKYRFGGVNRFIVRVSMAVAG